MTTIDLRLEYKKDTSDPNVPISNTPYTNTAYVQWLEERVIALWYYKTAVRLQNIVNARREQHGLRK